MAVPSETDKAYLAGILDSDGSIMLAYDNRERKTVRPLLAITNRSDVMLQWAKETFEAGFHSTYPRIPKNKIVYTLQIGSQETVGAILGLVLPYLKGKRRQGELVLEYCRNHQYGIYTERDWEIFTEVRALNRKGLWNEEKVEGEK